MFSVETFFFFFLINRCSNSCDDYVSAVGLREKHFQFFCVIYIFINFQFYYYNTESPMRI